MNKSNASQSNSDLSDSQEKPQNHKYPQFEEELYPKEKSDDKVSPIETSPKDKQNITNKNKEAPPPHPKDADVEVMDLSFRSQSNMSMDQSRKDWLLKESVDVAGMKSLDEKMKHENIGMTTSVQVTHQDILNKRDNTLKEKVHSDPQKGVQKDNNEMEESHYDFLNGHIKTNRTAKNPTEVEAESSNTKLVTQQSKHEIGELIDTVKKDRIFTEPDSVHENFADDNTLYHIHALMTSSRNISVQTHKKEDRKPDFLFGNVIVKILEANQVRDGMLRAYMVYKIQTKVVGNSEKEYIVTRRYRDFDALFEHLSAKYQGHVIPILPPKSIKTTLQLGDEEFYKTRKRELGVFLNNCLKHPFVKETDELEVFLTDQNGFHSSITKKDQGYFAWLNSDLWSNLFNLVSNAAKGDNGQTVYREKTNIDNELDNYENMFEILGKRLQAISQYLTQFLESRDKGIKATASFALELETIKMKKEELQDSKRQTTSLYSKGADVEKGLVASMLEKTKADLKDIMNIVEAVNVALKRRNAHIRELHKFQEIVEIKSLKAKKNLSSSQKLDELKSECKLWKEDLQKLSSTLLKEISQYQSEISESLNTFCQGIFQGNKQGLEKACELWIIKPEQSQ